MSMSEVFSVPFYALIKLCYTKAHEWSSLVPGPEVKSSLETVHRKLSGSSQSKDWTWVSCGSCIAGRFFSAAPSGKSQDSYILPTHDFKEDKEQIWKCLWWKLTWKQWVGWGSKAEVGGQLKRQQLIGTRMVGAKGWQCEGLDPRKLLRLRQVKGKNSRDSQISYEGSRKMPVTLKQRHRNDAGLLGQLSIRCFEFRMSGGLPGGDNAGGSWKCIFLKLS